MSPSRTAPIPGRPFGSGRILDSLREILLRTWYAPGARPPASSPNRLLDAASGIYLNCLLKDQKRLRRNRARLSVPVISIGNMTVGGTGKTPLALWLCRVLLECGLAPAVLSRGYGRRSALPARVSTGGDPKELSELFGDEPVMMALELPSVPVWVGSRRAVSGRAALSAGPVDVLVLDDAFQHLALERDLDIVLLDARNPFGNGRTLPAGPLREPISHLKRADALILTNSDRPRAFSEAGHILENLFPEKRVFSCRHELLHLRSGAGGPPLSCSVLRGRKVAAFAGIARPERFFRSIEDLGADVCVALAFPDHHCYRDCDVRKILTVASDHCASAVVTTAKDAVRLPAPFRELVLFPRMGIEFGVDDGPFRAFLKDSLQISPR
ncbi:MAG: tetraacyldisaccharide 4'-kinase [Desulfobacteraceae bacterium]|nr:tetraacyldisaccharide 4'-kinase [Desulfobacteraceae bacterium]